jgi:DNA-binding GntR family transcriptional regulator
MNKTLTIRTVKSIREKVYEYLREQLLDGNFYPYDRLIETKIAKEIGVSRTPVREALHSLELEGLIESIPRVGYTVKPISEKEVEEICEIRSVIECLAAKWATERAHEKLVRELNKVNVISEEKISKRDVKAFVELDAHFHEIIARLSGSKRLLDLAQTLRRHMLRYRIQGISSVNAVEKAINGHKRILKAIEKGDMEGIESAIKYHLEQVKVAVLTYVFSKNDKK